MGTTTLVALGLIVLGILMNRLENWLLEKCPPEWTLVNPAQKSGEQYEYEQREAGKGPFEGTTGAGWFFILIGTVLICAVGYDLIRMLL